jgi:UDP-N-acetylmuramate dehydrogenase
MVMAAVEQDQEMQTPWPGMIAPRGRLRANADLSKTNWFRVGGLAEWLFKPEDADDLAQFLAARPASVPLTILGVGSNVIIRDGGVSGVAIRLGAGFAQLAKSNKPDEKQCIEAGAACLDVHVAQYACDHGIAGLEFLSGIPGTIGGAVAMNAGAYGREIKDVLQWADAIDPKGQMHRLSNWDLAFRYRGSGLPEGWVVTRALLKGERGMPEDIGARMKNIADERGATQPVRSRTGGSTFKNPPNAKAWELIDKAGCRGLRRGGAQVSELHCNFLINTGDAKAADLEALGEEVRRRVKEHSGVQLEWEIKRMGNQ